MKKFAKGCLIAALSMLTVGVIILAVCTFIGGTKIYAYAHDEIQNNPYVEDFFVDVDDFFGRDIVSWNLGETHMSFNHNYPTHSGDDQDFQAALASDISNLELEIGAGSCIISESDDAYFHIYSKNANKYQYYAENGTFYVRGFDHDGKGVGDITLDQTSYSGISYTEKINNNADSTYAIECAGGNITIDFK